MEERNSNIRNDSFNNTANFKYMNCEIFLGSIVPWRLTVYIFINVIGVTVNALLLLAIYKDPDKRLRNPTRFFVANMALVDLLNSLFNIEELSSHGKNTICSTGILRTILLLFLTYIYHLTFPSVTALALERYLSISRPLWHKVMVTSRNCCISIAVIWFVNCVYTVLITYLYQPFLLTGYALACYLATLLIYFLASISIRTQHSSLATDKTASEYAKRIAKIRLNNQNRFLTTVLIINIFQIFGMINAIATHFKFSLHEKGLL